MTMQLATAVLAISGSLTSGSVPYALFINPAHMRESARPGATANALPEVELINSAGKCIGRATVQIAGRQCRIRIRNANLPTGNYRARLAHSAECFGKGGAEPGQLVDSASFAVDRNEGLASASFVFISEAEGDTIEWLIAQHGLMIQLVDLNEAAPVACGQLSRGD